MKLAARLLRWHARHGRHDLPWQHPRTPYRAWVSEIMLQQTQVATVLGYFERFMQRFPDLAALAAADIDDVLAAWAGLGYYSRARNMHAAARLCAGRLPDTLEGLMALPGIGRSTAGAILAQAHGARVAILDGNAKRLLARYHGIAEALDVPDVERALWRHAQSHLPRTRMADYTQAVMDLGATLCTRRAPRCAECPLAADCVAHRTARTDSIPRARAPRTLPEREVFLLLVSDARQRVLLERRAPRGIWGGLWSLPEARDRASAERELRARGAQSPRELAAITHTFTHFKLNATPLHVAATHIAEHAGQALVAREDAARYGCPAPVARLLERFWSEEN